MFTEARLLFSAVARRRLPFTFCISAFSSATCACKATRQESYYKLQAPGMCKHRSTEVVGKSESAR